MLRKYSGRSQKHRWTTRLAKGTPWRAGATTVLLSLLASTVWLSAVQAQSEQDTQAGDAGTTGIETDVQTGATAITQDQVRKLLRGLEADGIQQRDQAEQALIDLGPGVLKFLPEVTARTSGEMKIRLQRIRQSLESDEVEAFFDASVLTLKGKQKLAEVIDAIVEQTGNPISLRGEEVFATREVELDVVDRPFWEVVSRLMDENQLRINSFATTENELVLTPGGQPVGGAPAAFWTGPFRVEVISIEASRPFNATLGGQLGVSLQVTWEPRLKPVFMQIPMESVKAQVGGETLSATNPQAMPEIPLNYGGCTTQVDLQLQRPDRQQTQVDSLQGEFTIAVPSESHKYQFSKFGNGARQSEKFGDVTVVLEGARRNGAVYEMRLLVEFGDAQGALDSFRGWILSNKAYLLDAKGGRSENVGLQTYAITPNAVGVAYLFQINGDPNDHTLVYESPASVTKQTVKYELKDIPLP